MKKEGYCMKGNKSRYMNWLFFAEEDFNSAKALLNDKIYNQVCFHTQQAAEKSLKAFLKSRGIVIPKTHNLSELIHLCIKESNSFVPMEEPCQYLGRFYLLTRYPDAIVDSPPEGLPDENDAKKAIDKSKKVLKFVKKILEVSET